MACLVMRILAASFVFSFFVLTPVAARVEKTKLATLLRNDGEVDARKTSGVQLIGHEQLRKYQNPTVTQTTTHENFFQRMGNAFGAFIIGIILIIFSVPILFLNEKRNAKYETLISRGENDCREIGDMYDEDNNKMPVCATGDVRAVKPVKDENFNVQFESGTIKLYTTTEVYQYQEVEKSETTEKETLGGGKDKVTRTWQEYHLAWVSGYDSGQSFKDASYRACNKKPEGLQAGSTTATSERVEFGKGFVFGADEITQLSGGDSFKVDYPLVCNGNAKLQWELGVDCKYYARDGGEGKGAMESPKVGDARVSFHVLKDMTATVVGLQVAAPDKLPPVGEKGTGSFMPYRVIHRSPCPCFALGEDQEKQKLYKEAIKSKPDLAGEEMWQGIMWCCCCACNVVNCCFSGLLVPEIHDVFSSKMSKKECFDFIKSKAAAMKWIFRLVGWILMFAGLNMTFAPFTTALKIFPFGIGSFLSSLGGAIVGFFSFFVTVIVAILIIALAYCLYHPLYAAFAFTALAAVITGILVICNAVVIEGK